MDESAITIVLLAAGQSRRFGATDKLMAPLHGVPMVAHAARAGATIAGAARFAVISSQEVAAVVEAEGYVAVENSQPQRGVAHSIARALDAMAGDGPVLVMLGDMPGIEPTHLRALIDKFSGPRPVCSSRNGLRMPPAIFLRDMLVRAAAAGGDSGARGFLAEADPVPAPPHQLADVDSAADLAGRFGATITDR